MSTLLDEAIARLKALPEDRQNAAAAAMLDVIEALEEAGDEALTPEERAEALRRLAMPREDVPEQEMDTFFARYAAP